MFVCLSILYVHAINLAPLLQFVPVPGAPTVERPVVRSSAARCKSLVCCDGASCRVFGRRTCFRCAKLGVCCVQAVLEGLGQASDMVSQQDISLVCKNAANLRVVRSNSLEDEHKSANSADWSWVCLISFRILPEPDQGCNRQRVRMFSFVQLQARRMWAIACGRLHLCCSNHVCSSNQGVDVASLLCVLSFPLSFFLFPVRCCSRRLTCPKSSRTTSTS